MEGTLRLAIFIKSKVVNQMNSHLKKELNRYIYNLWRKQKQKEQDSETDKTT